MLKAVIFDMDGVIIDSEPMHARAALKTFQKFDIDLPEGYCTRFIGSTTYFMCQTICKEFQPNVSPEELWKANMDMKEQLLAIEGHTPVPFVIELIKRLFSRGLKLIIASSSPAAAIEEVMASLDISQYFEGYVSGMQMKNPKPAPDIFLAAAAKLQLDPKECIVIEDSSNGVKAAFAAGIPCIGFINPNSGNQDLSKAAILVEGFEEIDFDFLNDIHQSYLKHHDRESAIIAETERLSIRALSAKDADALFSLYHHPDILPFVDNVQDDVQAEKEKLEAYINHIYSYYGYGLWGVYIKDTNKLIGICGIELKNIDGKNEYEIGYLIHPKFQGKGYAYESTKAVIVYAFHTLSVSELIALIPKENTRSIQFAKKIGMTYQGESVRNNRTCSKYKLIRSS